MYKIIDTVRSHKIDKHKKGGWGEINIVSKYVRVKRKYGCGCRQRPSQLEVVAHVDEVLGQVQEVVWLKLPRQEGRHTATSLSHALTCLTRMRSLFLGKRLTER